MAIVARNINVEVDSLAKRGDHRHDLPYGHATIHFLEALPGAKTAKPMTCTLLQVSGSGLMVRAFDGNFSRGQLLAIHALVGEDEAVLRGRVRHCTQTISGYKIGIELEFS